MGGDIIFDSELGWGSVFGVEIMLVLVEGGGMLLVLCFLVGKIVVLYCYDVDMVVMFCDYFVVWGVVWCDSVSVFGVVIYLVVLDCVEDFIVCV